MNEVLSVLPTDREVIAALTAQCEFLVQQLRSALGHLDNRNSCSATRTIEFALNSVHKMPAHRSKRAKG